MDAELQANWIFHSLQAFEEELQSAKPVIADGLEYGSRLLEDEVIDDDNKAKVKQEVHHLEGELRKLEEACDDEHKR